MYDVRARVVTAKDMIGSDLLVQVVVSTDDEKGTRNPIFIPLPKDLENPSFYVAQNTLRTVAMLCADIPRAQKIFSEEHLDKIQAQSINEPLDPNFLPDVSS